MATLTQIREAVMLPGETLRDFKEQWQRLTEAERAEIKELVDAAAA